MNERELRRRLEAVGAPDELGSAERAWPTVRAAYVEREPVRLTTRRRWPLVALAAGIALVAAALTPPGRAVFGEMRERIGVEASRPALFSLPSPGRLLVESSRGLWVVHADGSKRLLAGYDEGSWSPHGLYVVATRRNELLALEPDGDVRWTLARRNVRLPRWGGTRTDTRIAYLSADSLRVVAGDGTGDRRLARAIAAVPPAWRPGSRHVVAYATAGGRVVAVDVDARRTLFRTAPVSEPSSLEWSGDGRSLLVRARDRLVVLHPDGRTRLELLDAARGAAPVSAAALAPSGRSLAFVQTVRGRSVLWTVPRLAADASAAQRVFAGAGRLGELAWSPDGRWLLVAWPDADQWLFVRSAQVRRIRAVSNISAQFGGGSSPSLAGWCCP